MNVLSFFDASLHVAYSSNTMKLKRSFTRVNFMTLDIIYIIKARRYHTRFKIVPMNAIDSFSHFGRSLIYLLQTIRRYSSSLGG